MYVRTLGLLLIAVPVLAQVRIQEILYDGPGSDADDAFTELTGPPGWSLDGWSLVGINGTTASAYRTVPLAGTIPADGVYVVATELAAPTLAQDIAKGELECQHLRNVPSGCAWRRSAR